MPEFVIQIDFTDRKGLGYDVFQLFERHGCDKIFMEVAPGHGMLIKFRSPTQQTVTALMTDLGSVDGVNSVGTRTQMAYEVRENELRTILNAVSEGIIAVDEHGTVTHINDSACEILVCRQSAAVGKAVADVLGSDTLVRQTLNRGKAFSFYDGHVKRDQRTIRFLASCVPIIGDGHHIQGAVITIKSESEIQQIISNYDRHHHMTAFVDIIYQSEKMHRVVETAKVVAKGNATVLLRGESGTGKELFARSIHTESPRKTHPFVAINCAAIPETLLESELFGYEAGAFTGAARNGKQGLFEQASQGTLFLDEVGELTMAMQARLLRVLQEGRIRRVGGTREIPVDVRILGATHRDLEGMLESGAFREDLYYRLNVIPLKIPPLRDRPEDISMIADFLLNKIAAKMMRRRSHLSRECVRVLESQMWPGNVRQLENVLERILNIVPEGVEITPGHLYEWTDLSPVITEMETTKDAIHVSIPLQSGWPTLREVVAQVEKQVIARVLSAHPSSRKAGRVLGVSNTTILNKVKAYHMTPPSKS
jgi:transcriptional regulator of aroF, aroG, tyrA and aromatic amino acid transport